MTNWQTVLPSRFISIDKFQVLKRLIQSGSKMENRDMTDRGYLLTQILKMLKPEIWAKMRKNFFIEKFANLDPSLTNE